MTASLLVCAELWRDSHLGLRCAQPFINTRIPQSFDVQSVGFICFPALPWPTILLPPLKALPIHQPQGGRTFVQSEAILC